MRVAGLALGSVAEKARDVRLPFHVRLTRERVRQIEPTLPTGFLTTAAVDPGAALLYVVSNGHAYVLPQAPAVFDAGQGFVEQAHAEGVRVGAWTVDLPDGIERLFAIGVDAVATNAPEVAVTIRDRFRTRAEER